MDDIVALTWQIQRLRLQRKKLMRNARRGSLGTILSQILEPPSSFRPYDLTPSPATILAWEWACGDKKSTKRVEELLAQAGLSWEDVDIGSLSWKADELEQLDAREELWGKRRDTILQQIERRRAGWAKQVKRSSEEIVEAEFREIPPFSRGAEAPSVSSRVEATEVSSGGEDSQATSRAAGLPNAPIGEVSLATSNSHVR